MSFKYYGLTEKVKVAA